MVEYKLIETAAVGIVTLTALNLLVKALSHLYKTFLRPAKNFKKYGKWAVVTGATGKKGTRLYVYVYVYVFLCSKSVKSL